MTKLCAAIFVRDVAQARRDAARAGELGADLVELRVDAATSAGELSGLLAGLPVPAIVTCRPTWEGGQSGLADAARVALLRELSADGAAYVDVELKTPGAAEVLAEGGRDARPGVIVSSHDFQGRPDRLYNVWNELNASAGDVTKIVWTARTVRDNIEAFELTLARHKPTIAICMGEAGLISRILARKFGAFLSFAAVDTTGGTAPGQVSLAEMKTLYRWDAIGAATKVYGVVGSPVGHSMSPAVHNAAFDATGFDGIYVPLLVNEGYESFKAFMEAFTAFAPLDLRGLSVTIPHKENALRYLKEKGAAVEELAERIGAVNTIAITPGAVGRVGLSGVNTDYAAILDCVTGGLGIGRDGLRGVRVAVIGAGGTGRTAVAALANAGATVVVYNRTRERAETLAAEFDGRSGKMVVASLEKLCDSCCDVYVNTTSVGMHPRSSESAWGERPPERLGEGVVVFDTVYNPAETVFLRLARERGARVVGGIEMFVRQAGGQFRLWTGIEPPAEAMRGVIERRLGVVR